MYFSFITPIRRSVNGPITLLAELTAKNRPSDPVGANDAVQATCRGDQNTSPTVMNNCHKQAPAAFGNIATSSGDAAITQSPGMMMEKSSLPLVIAPTMGGKIRHPKRLMLWMV